MGYFPAFRLSGFNALTDGEKFEVLQKLLDCLTLANVLYLRRRPRTPLLYESGVRYVEEPSGRDEWQDIEDTIARASGDCEDLACWRVAELRVVYREKALHHITVSDIPDKSGQIVTTYHIAVQRANGLVEDPSKRLGMT